MSKRQKWYFVSQQMSTCPQSQPYVSIEPALFLEKCKFCVMPLTRAGPCAKLNKFGFRVSNFKESLIQKNVYKCPGIYV